MEGRARGRGQGKGSIVLEMDQHRVECRGEGKSWDQCRAEGGGEGHGRVQGSEV